MKLNLQQMRELDLVRYEDKGNYADTKFLDYAIDELARKREDKDDKEAFRQSYEWLKTLCNNLHSLVEKRAVEALTNSEIVNADELNTHLTAAAKAVAKDFRLTFYKTTSSFVADQHKYYGYGSRATTNNILTDQFQAFDDMFRASNLSAIISATKDLTPENFQEKVTELQKKQEDILQKYTQISSFVYQDNEESGYKFK